MKRGILIKELGYYVVIDAKPESQNWVSYFVYEACEGFAPNEPKQWYLTTEEDPQGFSLTLDEYKQAFYTMSGSVVWRGVWDVRVYFKDEEYFDTDFDGLHKVYTQITELLKQELRIDNPDIYE